MLSVYKTNSRRVELNLIKSVKPAIYIRFFSCHLLELYIYGHIFDGDRTESVRIILENQTFIDKDIMKIILI